MRLFRYLHEIRNLLRHIERKLDRQRDNQETLMADTARLLQSSENLAAGVSSLGTDLLVSLEKIRTIVDDLRAVQVDDPLVQEQLDGVADQLDAEQSTLADTAATIRAAGDDPGSPVPPVEEPPVE